jgi:GH25 family lysozyme M1 (1,4-beta-N-acetylmuramidase)
MLSEMETFGDAMKRKKLTASGAQAMLAAVALGACALANAQNVQAARDNQPAGGALKPAPDIVLSPAAKAAIARDDHPMGSQIRKNEAVEPRTEADIAITPMISAGQLAGMDVSGWQGNVNWSAAWNNGARFAYVKATEGTGYTNPYFTQQYNGSYNVGMRRGAYHFARPDVSGGATQAESFVNHGGGWSADGKTLPGTLDIEYNPYGATCYGLSTSSMVSWIKAFSDRYHSRTGRYPVIYSTYNWWYQCTGNRTSFGSTNPLWIARYSTSAGTLPYGWTFYTFWQNDDAGVFPGDQDIFNGDATRLKVLATSP